MCIAHAFACARIHVHCTCLQLDANAGHFGALELCARVAPPTHARPFHARTTRTTSCAAPFSSGRRACAQLDASAGHFGALELYARIAEEQGLEGDALRVGLRLIVTHQEHRGVRALLARRLQVRARARVCASARARV